MKKIERKLSLLGVIFFLAFTACSGPLTEKDPSKGTIILSFGGVPASNRTATMSSIIYKVTIFDANDPRDDGTPSGTLHGGESKTITVEPGYYKIGISAELNGADYAGGETGEPGSDQHVQVTAGSQVSVSIKLTVFLDTYLAQSSSSNPIDLPLAVTLDSGMWINILTEIDNQPNNVNLDLS